jgi:DNA polymerase-1
MMPHDHETESTGDGTSPVLLLIDAHAHAYRAFHAIRNLKGPDGAPTNAIFGFVKAVEKLLASWQPSHVAAVWDGGLAEQRTDVLPDYKANRPPMPEALSAQMDGMAEWLEARGCLSLCADGVEADDWIARLAFEGRRQGARVLVSTSDKDFMQLVSEQVRLINPADRAGGQTGPAEVEAKTGVTPQQIVDWLSLVGDSVDNIAGVPGVGPKTATGLLRQFGSCESLYGRLSEVPSTRIREALEVARPAVERNRSLVRLDPQVAYDVAWARLELKPADAASLGALYDRWGFRSLSQSVRPEQGVLL